MGYMTVVSILNDAWETIKENPDQLLKNIEEGMNSYGNTVQSFPVGNHANPMEVHSSFHANHQVVLVVGGNHMEDLSEMKLTRTNDDYYLAYKMRMIKDAVGKAEFAKTKIMSAIADMIIQDMKRCGADVTSIKEIAENNQAYREMSDDDKKQMIWFIGCKFQE
jgi:hypothetical protein